MCSIARGKWRQRSSQIWSRPRMRPGARRRTDTGRTKARIQSKRCLPDAAVFPHADAPKRRHDLAGRCAGSGERSPSSRHSHCGPSIRTFRNHHHVELALHAVPRWITAFEEQRQPMAVRDDAATNHPQAICALCGSVGMMCTRGSWATLCRPDHHATVPPHLYQQHSSRPRRHLIFILTAQTRKAKNIKIELFSVVPEARGQPLPWLRVTALAATVPVTETIQPKTKKHPKTVAKVVNNDRWTTKSKPGASRPRGAAWLCFPILSNPLVGPGSLPVQRERLSGFEGLCPNHGPQVSVMFPGPGGPVQGSRECRQVPRHRPDARDARQEPHCSKAQVFQVQPPGPQ